MLIYFDQALQKRVIPDAFTTPEPARLSAARPHRDISGFSQLFSVVDKTNKIFARTALASTLRLRAPLRGPRRLERASSRTPTTRTQVRGRVDLAKHLDRLLLARYAPPGVLINEQDGDPAVPRPDGRYLQPAPGRAAEQPPQDGAAGCSRRCARRSRRRRRTWRPSGGTGVEVDQDGSRRTCNVVVVPFTGCPEIKEPLFVVLFEEAAAADARAAAARPTSARRRSARDADGAATDSQARARARRRRRSTCSRSSRSTGGPTTISARRTRSWSRATKSCRA